MGETHFSLVFGVEAILPCEIRMKSSRVELYSDEEEAERYQDDLNLLEEHRDCAYLRAAKYQQGLRRYYERSVKERSFQVGDLVLRLHQKTKHQNELRKWVAAQSPRRASPHQEFSTGYLYDYPLAMYTYLGYPTEAGFSSFGCSGQGYFYPRTWLAI